MRSLARIAGAFLVPLTLSAVEDVTGQIPVNTGARQIAVIVKDERQAVYRIPDKPKEPEKPKDTEKQPEKEPEKPKQPEKTKEQIEYENKSDIQKRHEAFVSRLPSFTRANRKR